MLGYVNIGLSALIRHVQQQNSGVGMEKEPLALQLTSKKGKGFTAGKIFLNFSSDMPALNSVQVR